jgi:hypothetical protein
METQTKIYQKTKGVKVTMVDLSAGETAIFPRTSYSTIRSSISILRVERPEREYQVSLIENGIEVLCLK